MAPDYTMVARAIIARQAAFRASHCPFLAACRLFSVGAQVLEAGVDIVEIDRVQAIVEHHGDRFLHRIYTTGELGQCRAKAQSLAARFAAKEAAFKVLGMRMGWRDIEVCRHDSGKPTLLLHGRAAARAQELGIRQLALSLSHSRDYAVAVVVAQG